MPIDDVVKVTITKVTATVSRAGFGTPCILAYFSTTHFGERARVYSSIDGLEADGFGAEHFVHKAMTAFVSQNPRVERVVVGRRALPIDRKVVLTPTADPPALTAYKVKVNDQTATFTTDETPTIAEITAGLVGQINALMPAAWVTTTPYTIGTRVKNGGNIYQCVDDGTSGATGPAGTRDDIIDGSVTWKYIGPTVTATDTGPGTSVLVDQDTPGAPFVLEVEKRALLTQEDTTADPGVATDLSAVRTEVGGNDDWYALLMDSRSSAEILAVAAAIEAIPKLNMTSNADDAVPTSATSDIASSLSAANYAQTALMWHTKTPSFPDAAWAGRCLPLDPGSETWRNKTLVGIVTTPLTATERGFLRSKYANWYEAADSVHDVTAEGSVASGEWIDVVRLIHALTARMKEDVFAAIVSVDKVPMTAAGLAIIENAMHGALAWAVGTGGLVDPYVTPPTIDEISPADRNARLARTFKFGGRLTGAIHQVWLAGELTV